MEENANNQPISSEELIITPESRMYLAETAKWSKFFAIVGFVFAGLMVLFALFFGTIMGEMTDAVQTSDSSDDLTGLMGGAMGFMYILLALMYAVPCYYLLQFAQKMQKALASDDTQYLTSAFENQKSVYKFWGILTIIIIGFYVLAILAVMVGGLGALI